jgi:hypothetical protein
MKNPWLSLWLSAANQWAGAARGFWTAEMARQQAALTRGTPKRKSSRSAKPRTSKAGSRPARKAGH